MFVSSSDERMIVREMTTGIRSTRTLSVLLVAVLRSGVQVLYMSRSLTALPTAHERPTAGLVELKRPWTSNYGGSRYGHWEMVVSVQRSIHLQNSLRQPLIASNRRNKDLYPLRPR